jgi:hypothetical protein
MSISNIQIFNLIKLTEAHDYSHAFLLYQLTAVKLLPYVMMVRSIWMLYAIDSTSLYTTGSHSLFEERNYTRLLSSVVCFFLFAMAKALLNRFTPFYLALSKQSVCSRSSLGQALMVGLISWLYLYQDFDSIANSISYRELYEILSLKFCYGVMLLLNFSDVGIKQKPFTDGEIDPNVVITIEPSKVA